MSNPSVSLKSNKRYNLKLPNTLRSVFLEPYDSYLYFLLSITAELSSFPPKLEDCMSELPAASNSQNAVRWTLWVSKDIRDRFDERKLILAPSKTHGGFVEMMLLYRNKLAESGKLPFFEAKMAPEVKKSSSPSSSSASSKKSRTGAAAAYHNPSLWPAPPLFHFASTMTLNDQMMLDASSYSYPMNGTPAFDSEASAYTNSNINGTMPFIYHNPSDSVSQSAKEVDPASFTNSVYASADTVNNFDEILNAIASPLMDTDYCPTGDEQQMAQDQAYFNSNIYHQNHKLFHGQQENYLPDLGPFYQPVSYNIGDQVHEYGYLPNL